MLLQYSWGWPCREMCLTVTWQVSRRGMRRRKSFQLLEFHFVPASVAPVLNRLCTLSIHLPFWKILEAWISVISMWGGRDGWLGKCQLPEFSSPGSLVTLQLTWCHLSCPQCRACWRSESSPQAVAAAIAVVFSWHAQQKLLGSEQLSFLCPRGGPFRKLLRHAHTETRGAGTALAFSVVKQEI